MTRELLASSSRTGPDAGRVKALNGAGGLAYWQNDFPTAAGLLHGAARDLRGARRQGRGSRRPLQPWATSPRSRATTPVAIEHYEQALALWRELGDQFGLASGLGRPGPRALPRNATGRRRSGQPRKRSSQAEASATATAPRASLGVIGRVGDGDGRLRARPIERPARPSTCSRSRRPDRRSACSSTTWAIWRCGKATPPAPCCSAGPRPVCGPGRGRSAAHR